MTHWQLRRAFPQQALQAITDSVRASELLHGGEIRVAIEAELSSLNLLRGLASRERASQVFALLKVWDTQARNGVLIYLCLADRSVEIIADQGLQAKVTELQWAEVCRQLQADCAAKNYQRGVCNAVAVVGQLIGVHYPVVDRNEQPDRPVLL